MFETKNLTRAGSSHNCKSNNSQFAMHLVQVWVSEQEILDGWHLIY